MPKLMNAIAVAVSIAALCVFAPAADAEQRYDRRSGEMAIADPVLDPFHAGRPIVPPPPPTDELVPDSVDHEGLDPDAVIDPVDQEVFETYLIEQGLMDDPHDHLRKDNWDGSAGPDAEIEDGGYTDPVEW